MAMVFVVMAGCGPKQAAAPSPAVAASGTPGQIHVECVASAAGYDDYSTSTTATNLDVCSVSPDGALSLTVKGEGADAVRLYIPGYHGAGTYPLTGASTFGLSNSSSQGGRAQSSENCRGSSACSAEITDSASGTAADAPHPLAFAVTCNQLCDMDTHNCTATPGGGGPVTWSFSGDCKVR